VKQDEIARCLVMLYASRSNDMYVNYNLCCDRVERLCESEPAKAELIRTLRKLADDIEGHTPVSREALIASGFAPRDSCLAKPIASGGFLYVDRSGLFWVDDTMVRCPHSMGEVSSLCRAVGA